MKPKSTPKDYEDLRKGLNELLAKVRSDPELSEPEIRKLQTQAESLLARIDESEVEFLSSIKKLRTLLNDLKAGPHGAH